MKLKKLLFIPIVAMLLTGCQLPSGNGGTSSCDVCLTRQGDDKDKDLPTPITDSLKFAQAGELEGKKFAGPDENKVDHLGYVSLKSCTDGDTANFEQPEIIHVVPGI